MAAAEVQGSVDQAIGEVDQEVEELEKQGKEMENLSKETETAIELLSTGLLSAFLPEMDDMKERIRELTKNQGILIETMQQENAKFGESQEAKALIEIVKNYHSKLNRIHLEMEQINERVARLKRRAHKLKGQKEKEEKNKLDAKKREQEIERQLIAKPAADQESIDQE